MTDETNPTGQPAQVKVTMTDLGTGDSDSVTITDDYVITCAGSCYVHHIQTSNGTHVITIKGRRGL
jgi:hypothetical protein